MAGRPRLRAMLAEIADRGGVDVLIERIESGATLTQVAREWGLSRAELYHWLVKDPERAERLRVARARSAASMAETTLELADTGSVADVPKTKLQIEARRWLAGKLNPAEFGEVKGPQVQVSIGELHLDALRHFNHADNKPVLELSASESGT